MLYVVITFVRFHNVYKYMMIIEFGTIHQIMHTISMDINNIYCTCKKKDTCISKVLFVCEVPNTTSKYTGVCWNKDLKQWKARLMHKGKEHFGGYFDNEEHAAMKVNLLCDKIEIQRKNPTIMIESNAIQRVIMWQK